MFVLNILYILVIHKLVFISQQNQLITA